MKLCDDKSLICNLKLLSLRLDARCSNQKKKGRALTYEIANCLRKADYGEAGKLAGELAVVDSATEAYTALSYTSSRLGLIYNVNNYVAFSNDKATKDLKDMFANLIYFSNYDDIMELKEVVKIISKKVGKEFIKDVMQKPETYVMPKVTKALSIKRYPNPEDIDRYLVAVAKLNEIPYCNEYLKNIMGGSVAYNLESEEQSPPMTIPSDKSSKTLNSATNITPPMETILVSNTSSIAGPAPPQEFQSSPAKTIVKPDIPKPNLDILSNAQSPAILGISALKMEQKNNSIEELEKRINELKRP